jgi:hypothetical protein
MGGARNISEGREALCPCIRMAALSRSLDLPEATHVGALSARLRRTVVRSGMTTLRGSALLDRSQRASAQIRRKSTREYSQAIAHDDGRASRPASPRPENDADQLHPRDKQKLVPEN